MLEIAGVSAKHRTAVDDNIISNNCPVVDGHVGVNDAVFTNLHMISHKCARLNDGAFTYLSLFAHHFFGWLETTVRQDNLVECVERAVVNDESLAFRALHISSVDDDGGSRRTKHSLIIFRVIDKCYVTGLNLVKLIEPRDDAVGIADDFGSTNKIG